MDDTCHFFNRKYVHQSTFLSKLENGLKLWIHTYVSDRIVTEEANLYTDIEGVLTKLEINVVDRFIESVIESVAKVFILLEPAILEKVGEKLQRKFAGSLSITRSKPLS
jgi:hypothetical protein